MPDETFVPQTGNTVERPATEWPAPRTDIDLNHFRQRLEEEKKLAEETIRRVQASYLTGSEMVESAVTGNVSRDDMINLEEQELSENDENHPADAGTELQLREQDHALIENAQDILRKVARAFEKMDEGTYGLSDRSHQPIPVERLEAIPYAVFTAQEQETIELS